MHVFISGIFSINSSDRSCVANITCLTKIIPGVGNLPQYKVCSSPLTSFWKQRNNSLKIILLCWFTCKFAISIDVLDNWTIFFLSKNVMYFYREKNPALEWPLCTNCDLFALNWPIFLLYLSSWLVWDWSSLEQLSRRSYRNILTSSGGQWVRRPSC